eukprot:7180328-Prymnesium_polylepis.1
MCIRDSPVALAQTQSHHAHGPLPRGTWHPRPHPIPRPRSTWPPCHVAHGAHVDLRDDGVKEEQQLARPDHKLPQPG